jgi:hypothetical protein
MIFIFLFDYFFIFCLFGVLHQAVRAVSKKRPKPPILDNYRNCELFFRKLWHGGKSRSVTSY